MNFKAYLVSAVLMAGGVAGGLLRSRYERNHFVVEETTIISRKIKQQRTLVFLSDLHDKEFGKGNSRFIRAICQIRPDAILIGGDSMVAKPGRIKLDAVQRLLDGLCGHRQSGISNLCPIYYANGNHEQRMRRNRETYGAMYEEFQELLKERGIFYLPDSSELLGDDIRISGLDIDQVYYRDVIPKKMRQAYVESHLGKADGERFQILLAHSPLFFDAYESWGADLTLSGHFHGGTIRVPGLGGMMTPQFQFFLPWCAGTFEKNGHYMIVSRGLGTHSVNIRLWNKPQVVVVKLQPETVD